MTDADEVWWFGRWECDACGQTGETDWPGGATPDSWHDCGQDDGDGEDITWAGEWRCDACGQTGDSEWTDGDTPDTSHACDQDDEEMSA